MDMKFITYLLTYSMEQSPSWEANRFAASQEIPPHLMEPEGSLPHSQVPATCPYPESTRSSPYPHIPLPEDSPGPRLCLWIFRYKIRFNGENLTPRPTPKLEDHPLSAFRDFLFNIFAGTLHTGGRSTIRQLRARHAVVTETHLSHGARLIANMILWIEHLKSVPFDRPIHITVFMSIMEQ